jgi:transposase InsO family protein
MPWKESHALEQRNGFITEWLKGEQSITELSEVFEISRKTAYKWLERFDKGGRGGLSNASRAPHHSPQAISEAKRAAIVAERQLHPSWGSRKIAQSLMRQHPKEAWPAASSIGDLLKREGLIQGRRLRRRTPPHTAPLEHAQQANQVWCVDFKGWFRYGDGGRCDPFTTTDALSRALLCCQATDKADGVHVRGVMEATFRKYGLPQAIRSDNGSPFASRAPGGLSRLSMWWMQLGIRHERIVPGHPEQNGRHERMHRTLKQETANPPKANRRLQQEAFVAFQTEYNEQRPHEALGWKTPAELYIPSTQAYPARLRELAYPPGVHLRRISQQGSLKWRCERTFLSAVLARQNVGLLETEEDFFDVYYGPLLIGWFDGRSHSFAPDQPEPRRRRVWPKA